MLFSADLRNHSCGSWKKSVWFCPVSTFPPKRVKSEFFGFGDPESDFWVPGTHFRDNFGTLAARCSKSKEFQWFGAVLGTTFCLLEATGALLTPKGGPGAEKVVRDLKNRFWVPGDASAPTRQEIEAAFPMVCAWVPQGTHGSEFPSKK